MNNAHFVNRPYYVIIMHGRINGYKGGRGKMKNLTLVLLLIAALMTCDCGNSDDYGDDDIGDDDAVYDYTPLECNEDALDQCWQSASIASTQCIDLCYAAITPESPCSFDHCYHSCFIVWGADIIECYDSGHCSQSLATPSLATQVLCSAERII